MRLRPVFPITGRLASEDFALGDLTIPAGTLIIPHITLVHRRPDLYPDPLAFRPQRFLDGRAGTYTWIPFGGGARRCIGAGFSPANAGCAARCSAMRDCSEDPAPDASRHTVAIAPARGATVSLERRASALH
jgi:cytochrome P450